MPITIETLLTQEQRAALGVIVAESASLEATVDLIISHLTNLNPQQYEIVLKGEMIKRKLEVLKAIGQQKLRSAKRKAAFLTLMARLTSLNSDRNTLVHGIWGPRGGYRLSWFAGHPITDPIEAIQRSRGGRVRTLPANRIGNVARNVTKAHSELYNFWREVWLKLVVQRGIRRDTARKVQP